MTWANTLLLTVLCAGTVFAQAPTSPVVGQPGANPPDTATVTPKSIRGCLNSANDTYTLTDQASGKTYKIAGDTTKLKQHIGQVVEISGDVQSVSGASEQSGGGQTLNLGDVKEVAATCPSGESFLLAPRSRDSDVPVLIAQRPSAPDANNDLNSSAPFSSNSSDTSSLARKNSTVTTNQQTSTDVKVTGHAGQHQQAIDTSSTSSVGQTTLPANSAPGGFNNNKIQGNGGAAEVLGGKTRNERPATANGAAPQGGQNPALSNTQDEGNRAAPAASRAEMHTNPQTGKTTFSTMRQSEENGAPRANPKVNRQPNPNQSGTNNEPK